MMPAGIGESVQSRLRSSPYFAIRKLSCEYRDGVLRLQGDLPTYYLKQVAQRLVAEVEGVTEIINDVAVRTVIRREPLR